MVDKEKIKLEKLMYSVEEAAEVTGIGRSTMYKMVSNKDIPSVKIGKRRLIPVEALKKWIEEHTEG